MKKALLFFLALPLFATGQNYLFEITPQNGEFRVLVTDDTKEAYPRDVTDFGLLDTAEVQLFAYQRIENAKSRQAQLRAQSFIASLNAEQTAAAIGAIVPVDYAAWVQAQYAGVFAGTYQYTVRGTATNFLVVLNATEVRRQSNNNLLGTYAPEAGNYLKVTVNGTNEVIELYQTGNIWVGRNALGQIVTLKKL